MPKKKSVKKKSVNRKISKKRITKKKPKKIGAKKKKKVSSETSEKIKQEVKKEMAKLAKKNTKKKSSKKKSRKIRTTRKRRTSASTKNNVNSQFKKEVERIEKIYDKRVDKLINDNFTSLQKVLTNLAVKFDGLSDEISKLLSLFEVSARALVEKDMKLSEPIHKENKDISELRKTVKDIADQNKVIARGLTILHEREPEYHPVMVEHPRPSLPPSQRIEPEPPESLTHDAEVLRPLSANEQNSYMNEQDNVLSDSNFPDSESLPPLGSAPPLGQAPQIPEQQNQKMQFSSPPQQNNLPGSHEMKTIGGDYSSNVIDSTSQNSNLSQAKESHPIQQGYQKSIASPDSNFKKLPKL